MSRHGFDIFLFKETNIIFLQGAVIAQVALTALSLVDIKKTHWTTRGFFFLSVIAACICVITACINQSVLSSFFDCGFTDWVTKSRGSSRKPSRSAVLKLAFPGQCLFLAVAFFAVGLSEYLGCLMNVSTAEFIKERADFRNIFIMYMVGLGCFLIWIVLIFVLDSIEHLGAELWNIGYPLKWHNESTTS